MDSLGMHLGFMEIQLLALSLCLPLFSSPPAPFSLMGRNLAGAAPGPGVDDPLPHSISGCDRFLDHPPAGK